MRRVPGFEFIIHHRAVSMWTRNRAEYHLWMGMVRAAAESTFPGEPFGSGTRLTVFFLCDGSVIDADNVIKPIQDALTGLVYHNDWVVSDVESHRRMVREPVLLSTLPALLRDPMLQRRQCVYVRVDPPGE